MAIEITPETETGEVRKDFHFPIWMIWLFVLMITFGVLLYFLFFQKPKQEELDVYTKNQEVLTVEELSEIQDIIKKIDNSSIERLDKTVPKSIFSSPPKSKIGSKTNPFSK